MDIYSFLYDQSWWNLIFTLVTFVGSSMILVVSTKDFSWKKWLVLLYALLYLVLRAVIAEKISTSINSGFLEPEIHSVIIDQIEWRPGAYRCKLKDGKMYFGSSNEDILDQIGDSIVKKAKTDSFYVYRKDTLTNEYALIRKRKYYVAYKPE